MSAKNTISMLETIKKKIQKFDNKSPGALNQQVVGAHLNQTTAAPKTPPAAPKFEDNLGFDDLDLDNESAFSQQMPTIQAPAQKPPVVQAAAISQVPAATSQHEMFAEDEIEDFEGEGEDVDSELVNHITNEQQHEEVLPAAVAPQQVVHKEEDDFDFESLEKEIEEEVKQAPKKEAKKNIDFDNLDDVSLEDLEKELPQISAPKAPPAPAKTVPMEKDEVDLEFEKEFIALDTKPKVSNTDFRRPEPVQQKNNYMPPQAKEDWQRMEVISKMSKPFEMTQQQGRMLMNEDTIRQTTQSVKKLVDAKNLVSGVASFSQSPQLAEIAIHLLEPKLEKWLNEHLAEMVEEIVREEISKIVPK